MSEKKYSLCSSCFNDECIFQSGIYRETCDFYKPASIQDIKHVISLLQNFVHDIEEYEEENQE